jgi:cell division protein FtsB
MKVGVGALVLVAFLFVFVFPTRTYLQQRGDKNAAEHHLQLLRQQTQRLKDRTEKLGSGAEIERMARERFGMIRPGETPYVIVPAAPTTQPTTTTAPPGTTP